MRLVRFSKDGAILIGVVDQNDVVDLQRDARSLADAIGQGDMVRFIEAGEDGLRHAAQAIEASRRSGSGRVSIASVRLLAPIAPRAILASGGNYSDHREEKDEAPLAGREPEFFVKTNDTVIGPEDQIELDPKVTKKLDYECELAVIIGRKGRHITEADALDHVYAYTILNDVCARDRQVRFRDDGSYFYEVGPSKNFDTACPIGPYLVTRDEIADPQALTLQTHVNGELRQNNTTGNMTFGVRRLIAFFSTFLTLRPGYVITTGTPGGTAWASDRELGGRPYDRNDVVRARGYLQHGDEVRCTIEGLGELRNTIVAIDAAR